MENKILAIKGHSTRGKEVLEILEMLDGKNGLLGGGDKNFIYYIKPSCNYIQVECINNCNLNEFVIFTLEEFLEKYPYKVGDKVQDKGLTYWDTIYVIEKMIWEDNQINYIVHNSLNEYPKYTITAEYLQPYKEETMEERNEKSVNHVFNTEVISVDIAKKDKYELDLQGKFKVVLRKGKYYVERIKPKYPKTYKECCEVLGINTKSNDAQGYKADDIICLQELLIYRDAYWKIAGDWNPIWDINIQIKYLITRWNDNIIKETYFTKDCILAFPTEEMRDAFYENFKDLIEKCKEFL